MYVRLVTESMGMSRGSSPHGHRLISSRSDEFSTEARSWSKQKQQNTSTHHKSYTQCLKHKSHHKSKTRQEVRRHVHHRCGDRVRDRRCHHCEGSSEEWSRAARRRVAGHWASFATLCKAAARWREGLVPQPMHAHSESYRVSSYWL